MSRPSPVDAPAVSELPFADGFSLARLAGYVLTHNGIFVTCCIALIGFQTYEKRERDAQILAVLVSNAKILSDLTKAVTENDLRDQRSLAEMNPTVVRLEAELKEIKSELQRMR